MTVTIRALGLLLAAVAAVILTGCIEFERQTILMKLDAEKDVLHVRLIYQGIYAGKVRADDLKDLKDVAEGEKRFFLMDNWPLEVDLGADEPGSVLLRRHTTVKNGTFFLDAKGKLCGWQDIRIEKASKLLAHANRLISGAILLGKDDVLDKADDDTLAGNRALALGGHAWFRLDGEGVHFEFAISRADAGKLKRGMLESVAREAREAARAKAEAAETAPTEDGKAEKESTEITQLEAILRFFEENTISLVHRGQRARISIPTDERGVMRLDFTNEGKYVPNLLEPAKGEEKPPELPKPIDEEMTVEKLVKGFTE